MFVFVDIETGGLPGVDGLVSEIPILEVGVVVVDQDLETVDIFSGIASHDEDTLKAMNEWCVDTHQASGLWDLCLISAVSLEEIDAHLEKRFAHLKAKKLPMCGSSIHFDRQFIQAQMPKFNSIFHYRNLDVSSLRCACEGFDLPTHAGIPKPEGTGPAHRVLPDIEGSIRALSFYRQTYLKS